MLVQAQILHVELSLCRNKIFYMSFSHIKFSFKLRGYIMFAQGSMFCLYHKINQSVERVSAVTGIIWK